METNMVDLSGDLCYSQLTLCEESNSKKNDAVLCTVGGTFMELEKLGTNDRFYPEAVKDKIIGTPYTERCLKYKTLFGEPHHPADERYSVWCDEASHSITELHYDPKTKTIYGKADILDTPKGRILNTLIRYGSIIGISARSYGLTYKKGKTTYVDPDSYVFKTFDFTTNPGFVSARVEKMNEEEKDQFSSTLASLTEECDDLQALAIVRDYSEACGLQNVVSKADQVIQDLTGRRTSAEEDLKAGFASLQSSFNTLQERSESYLKSIDNLKYQLDSAYSENMFLTNTLNSLRDTSDTQAHSIIAKDQLIKALTDCCSSLRDTLYSRDVTIQELTDKLEQYKTTDELIKSKEQEIESQTKKYNDLVVAIEDSKFSISDLSAQNNALLSENTELQREIESLKDKCSDSEADLDSHISLVEKYKERVITLNSQIESLKSSLSSVKEELTTESSLNSEYLSKIKSLEEKLKNFNRIKEENEALKEDIVTIEKESLTEEAEDTRSLPSIVSTSVEIGTVSTKQDKLSSLSRMLSSMK